MNIRFLAQSEYFNGLHLKDDIILTKENYVSEDEYLCYLNEIIYNLENKIGNIFKSV